jgi:hypothetical protein
MRKAPNILGAAAFGPAAGKNQITCPFSNSVRTSESPNNRSENFVS